MTGPIPVPRVPVDAFVASSEVLDARVGGGMEVFGDIDRLLATKGR